MGPKKVHKTISKTEYFRIFSRIRGPRFCKASKRNLRGDAPDKRVKTVFYQDLIQTYTQYLASKLGLGENEKVLSERTHYVKTN